jgi:hypothetical protein
LITTDAVAVVVLRFVVTFVTFALLAVMSETIEFASLSVVTASSANFAVVI